MERRIMTQISTMSKGLQIRQGGRWLFRIAVCLLSVASVSAQDADRADEWAKRYPSGSIVSVEAAERALAEAKEEHAAIDRRFAAEQHRCYADFFASSCIAEAKERRRVSGVDVRKVEVDANAFLRKARVDERDRVSEEKGAAAAQKEAERATKEREGRPPKAGKQQAATAEPAPAHAASNNKRIEQHEAKLRRIEEKERADAQKRAENVAAYERKTRDAEERQRQVEAKKKEKEQERAKRGLLN
jgi:hypothetical protein